MIITGDALVDGGKLSIGSQNSTESTLIIEGDLTIGTKNVSEGNKTYTGTLTTHASTVVIKKSIEGTGSISVSQTTKMAVLKTIDDGISITVATSNNGNGSGGGDASDRVYSSESFEIYYGNGNGKDKNTNTTTDQTSSAYIAAMDALNENKELLPIVLVSFSYEVSLNEFLWETASEYHNAYFVVEYSQNGRDWFECTEHVASMSTTGYVYTIAPNVYVRNALVIYFRLKQVDYNGECSYSSIESVTFSVNRPCSEEYSTSKIQIRELAYGWYRIVNNKLVYCESDN